MNRFWADFVGDSRWGFGGNGPEKKIGTFFYKKQVVKNIIESFNGK